MAPHNIVDLLSSDDEKPMISQKPPLQKLALHHDFNFSDDDFASPVQLPTFAADRPSKRRRLSPTLPSEEDAIALPKLSRPPQRSGISGTLASTNGQANEVWATLDDDDDDPIVFTSSITAAEARANVKKGKTAVLHPDGCDSDGSLPDEIFSASSRIQTSALSSRTAAILNRLSQPQKHKTLITGHKGSLDHSDKVGTEISLKPIDEGESSGAEVSIGVSRKAGKAARKPKLTEDEKVALTREKEKKKAAKAQEREIAKATSKEQKAKEKEEDKERKRRLKEEQAIEKKKAAERAEVNKLRIDKKETALEMIVDLPASIDGQTVDTQIKEAFDKVKISSTMYQSSIPNVIKWRRKTKARWNEEEDCFEPLQQLEIHDEKHIMCLISAKDLVDLAVAQDDHEDIDSLVAKLKISYPDCIPIYLIEGLSHFMAKSKNAENRAYQARVNSLAAEQGGSSGPQQVSKRKKSSVEIVDEDIVEDALLRLQVMNGCLVHHTDKSSETAQWVAMFTQNISQIPYR